MPKASPSLPDGRHDSIRTIPTPHPLFQTLTSCGKLRVEILRTFLFSLSAVAMVRQIYYRIEYKGATNVLELHSCTGCNELSKTRTPLAWFARIVHKNATIEERARQLIPFVD